MLGIPRESRGISENLGEYISVEPCHLSSSPRILEKCSLKIFSSLAISENPRENFPGIYSLSKALAGIPLVPSDTLRELQPPGIAGDWRKNFLGNPRYSLDISGNFSRQFSEILRESWRKYLSAINSQRFPENLGESLQVSGILGDSPSISEIPGELVVAKWVLTHTVRHISHQIRGQTHLL
jgi:hypothetical protein